MSVLTPSRMDLLAFPNHIQTAPPQPPRGGLLPSALPPPPASVSPRKSFIPPAPFAMSRARGSYDPFTTHSQNPTAGPSSKHGMGGHAGSLFAPPPPLPSPRGPLGRLDQNHPHIHAHAQALLRSSNPINGSTAPPSTARAIPRPAAAPDVFAPSAEDSKYPYRANLLTGAHKRARENIASGAKDGSNKENAKRAKLELALSQKSQGDAWIAKWIRTFPTLIFHFEMGAEEGGKALKPRILKLGAKIDQFFSQRVSHLIVKNVSSPQKPKAALKRGDPARDSPKNPFMDNTGTTDLVKKAEALGIKVWTIKKLSEILARVAPLDIAKHDSLHTLLEDERLNGTRERDLNAPRADWYYFKKDSKYMLVEDALGKHKPIMVKEYEFNAMKAPEYPILYETFLRISAGTAAWAVDDPAAIRERAWSLYVEQQPYRGEMPPAVTLPRSTSLRNLPDTPRLSAPMPYQNASGNSVVITSNIASTSNANPSPAFPTLGKGALVQMSKRVQVLKNNTKFRQDMPLRRASTGFTNLPPPRAIMSQEQVIKMLQQAREPVVEEPPTAVERRANRMTVEAGEKGKDQDSAAGYCEGCRVRYPDLSQHIKSKRHRKFAKDDKNFAELDELLANLQRPINPFLETSNYPPCNVPHTRYKDCELCKPQFELASDCEAASGTDLVSSQESHDSQGSQESDESSGSSGSSGSEGTEETEEESSEESGEGEGEDE